MDLMGLRLNFRPLEGPRLQARTHYGRRHDVMRAPIGGTVARLPVAVMMCGVERVKRTRGGPLRRLERMD
jgi:hypothetical protein